MNSSRSSVSQLATEGPLTSRPDAAGRRAGDLLLLTAIVTVVAVVGRMSAGADQPALAESLAAIAASKGLYGIGGAARCIAGITLLAGAYFLGKTCILRERPETVCLPVLFAVSGVCTVLSGACAVVLAASAPDTMDPAGPSRFGLSVTAAADLRRLTGMAGFALAGCALVVAARLQWKAGGSLRSLAPVSAILGVAMQFIWVDAATVLHQIAGTAFLVWLVLAGRMLRNGRVEQQFAARGDRLRTA